MVSGPGTALFSLSVSAAGTAGMSVAVTSAGSMSGVSVAVTSAADSVVAITAVGIGMSVSDTIGTTVGGIAVCGVTPMPVAAELAGMVSRISTGISVGVLSDSMAGSVSTTGSGIAVTLILSIKEKLLCRHQI